VNVYLCEKPAQAKLLATHIGATRLKNDVWFGAEVAVVAARGHLLELAKADEYVGKGSWKIADLPILPQEWVLKIKSDKQSKIRFETIKSMLAKATHVIVATDPDDEGELIARDILSFLNYTGKVSRLWVSALNTEGLSVALANLRPLSETEGNYRAAAVRRKLDWLFGMNLSRVFSVKFKKTTNIGRIKTQLMSQLVERDRAIEAFKPIPYHTVHATTSGGEVFQYAKSSAAPVFLSEEEISKLRQLERVCGRISSVIEDQIEVAPPQPYSFSALLADGALMGIALKNGAAATQSLYEAGAISYPRTSSRSLPSEDNQKFAAHSAIIKTGDLPVNASTDMVTIFNLIQQNLAMHSLGNAKINRRTVVVDVLGNKFKLQQRWSEKGKEGFISALPPEHPLYLKFKNVDRNVPKFYHEGAKMTVVGIQVQQLETEAPPPYNESSLLQYMSLQGIGTEATRAVSICNLMKDGMALAFTQLESPDNLFRIPISLCSTSWAKLLVNNLPPSILGSDMTDMVKSAQDAARIGETDTNKYLLDATKWMLRVVPAFQENITIV
jgi:DNA topoisomerase-3